MGLWDALLPFPRRIVELYFTAHKLTLNAFNPLGNSNLCSHRRIAQEGILALISFCQASKDSSGKIY